MPNTPNTQELHATVEFREHLRMTNPITFRTTIASDIDSAKTFDFDLLVLAPLA
jgi:hypothetical protein